MQTGSWCWGSMAIKLSCLILVSPLTGHVAEDHNLSSVGLGVNSTVAMATAVPLQLVRINRVTCLQE